MFEYLALTDGTTIVDFTDNISYALVSYAPVVAALADNELAVEPYQDVQETITFHAMGCTAAEAYAAAATVNALLDQARRWWLGQNVSAVTLLMRVQGTTITTPLQVALKGRPAGGPAPLTLPAQWNATHGKYVIQNIAIQFVRRGQILGALDSTATSSTGNNPVVQTRTFAASIATKSPVAIQIGGLTAIKAPTLPASFLLIAPDTNKLSITDISGNTNTAFTTVNDSANKPIGGTNVLRYTPTGTAFAPSGSFPSLLPYGSTYGVGILHLFALVRNNSASVSFQLSATLLWGFAGAPSVTSTPVTVDTSSQQPRWVYLGTIVLRDAGTVATSPTIAINVSAASLSGSPTFDLNAVAQLNGDDETSQALSTVAGVCPSGGTNFVIQVDPQALTRPTAQVAAVDTSGGIASPIRGSGNAFLSSAGSTIAAAWLACKSNFWVFVDNTNAVLPVTLQASRRPAVLVPS